MMQLTVITGMSGAGKTQALRFFEDKGHFCIDNMPPVLLPRLMEMYMSMGGENAKVVLVIDARVGTMIAQLLEQVHLIKSQGHDAGILFLDADDETLVSRYKETRRTHPINPESSLTDSIAEERQILREVYNAADVVIDTSNMKLRDLYNKLSSIYSSGNNADAIRVHVTAFGFKYGAPLDADLVFDVRCLPNPFYIEELKYKTGNDKEVQDYVMQFPQSKDFLKKIEDMAEFLLPLYIAEGRNNLTIAVGCTGGKHRSVTFANRLRDKLKTLGYSSNCIYRDIDKE